MRQIMCFAAHQQQHRFVIQKYVKPDLMPFQTFDRNSLAFFATLAATLTLFASSLLYNRIEAPLTILILIAAILLRGQIFTHFDKVKILLIIHTAYAISLLSNGISFGSRAYTSFDAGVSNFIL